MTPVTTPPLPGSMTVPPLFGWQQILIAMTLLVIVAVAALVVLAAGKGVSGRSEWRAWLDGRSARSGGADEPVAVPASFSRRRRQDGQEWAWDRN